MRLLLRTCGAILGVWCTGFSLAGFALFPALTSANTHGFDDSLIQGPATQRPLDDPIVKKAATLPPGYTVFSVDTAERGLLKKYPNITRLSNVVPPGVVDSPGLVYQRYGSRELKLDLFRPKEKGSYPAVIIVHGGAWITGNHTMENPFAIELARRGYVAATVEYRLSNEAKYPAQIHDLKASVRWLRANAARYHIDPNRIGAIGASAGGHLVALLGATNGISRFEGDVGNTGVSSAVQSVVDIDGPATFIDPGNIEKEKKGPYDTNTRLIGGTYEEKPDIWREASPITHVNRKSSALLFINSSSYRPFQQREEMSAQLKALGIRSDVVVIPDTPHPFWLFHPWFDVTIQHVVDFLKQTMIDRSSGLPNTQPSKADVQAAMKRAARFMVEEVAYRGGYVWAVSEDFSRRYGEVPARATQIWVQEGTPLVGMTLLDAFDLTGDRFYLDGALKAADALVYGQHPLGGWHYFVDFDPKGINNWYREEASRFKWGMEEYRHYYGNATFDDSNTASATHFLLRLYTTTRNPRYRRPLLKALNFILMAQYPNGAWPQRYPLRHEFTQEGFPDYTSYYTLNDGSARSNIEVLIEAYEKLGGKRYLESAKRGVKFMILIQGPADQAAWAEQYDPKTMLPVKARTHEPAGFVVRESIQAIGLLEVFYQLTGDRGYLKPIPGCLDWFDRVNREAFEFKRAPARYYQPGTNLPIYNLRTDETNKSGYGLYRWSTKEAQGDGFGLSRFSADEPAIRQVVNVAPIRREYEQIAALSPAQARAKFRKSTFNWDTSGERIPPSARQTSVAEIISSMDRRGAWIRDDVRVLTVSPRSQAINPGTFEMIRGYSTAVFVRNLRALIDYSRASTSNQEITWQVDNLRKIGGEQVSVIGNPLVIAAPGGKAVMFDGADDALVVNVNPVAGARTFTIEAVFRPDRDGGKEQRWLHIQQENSENRVLLETRLEGDQWFLDTFIKSGENSRTLLAVNFKHALGVWYHVALVYDGTEMRHYVNGQEELAGPLSISPLDQGQTFIGVRSNRVYWFKGAIRKARFTLKALRPSEFMGKN